MPLLIRDDPALCPTAELAVARRQLESYAPDDPVQVATRHRFLDFLTRHPDDAHQRSCLEGHLTASALVIEAGGGRVLLTHHRKLGRWLQLGGHCDGDANLPGVALREAIEESGIAQLQIDPRIVDLDIHPIPARPGEPEHLHYDVRFLVVAPRDAQPVHNHESHALRWLSPDEALAREIDESVERLVGLLAEHHP